MMVQDFLSGIGSSVAPVAADHLWQSTLVAVLAGLLAFALRGNQARARYWLWMTASMKFLLPFSLLANIGSHFAKPRAQVVAQPELYLAMDSVSQPFTHAAVQIDSPVAVASHTAFLSVLPAVLPAVWLCGFVVVLAVWLMRWRRVRRVVREAEVLQEGREVAALRRAESTAGMSRPLQILLS